MSDKMNDEIRDVVADTGAREEEPRRKLVEYDQNARANLVLLHKGNRSDATLKCGDHVWRLHKAIVCERNDYFRAALDGGFAEGATGEMAWDDEEPFAVEGLLMWLYTYHYPEPEHLKQFDLPSSMWQYHHDIWTIADRRQAAQLKEEAMKKLCDTIREQWDAYDFISMAPTIWRSDYPDSIILQDAARSAALANYQELQATEDFFERLIDKGGKFSQDYVKVMMKEVTDLNAKCTTHKKTTMELTEKLEAETTRANSVTEIMRKRDRKITEMRKEITILKGGKSKLR